MACGGRLDDLRDDRHGDFVHEVIPADAATGSRELIQYQRLPVVVSSRTMSKPTVLRQAKDVFAGRKAESCIVA